MAIAQPAMLVLEWMQHASAHARGVPVADITDAPQSHVKVALASLICTASAWYDLYSYNTAAALIFTERYIPNFDTLF